MSYGHKINTPIRDYIKSCLSGNNGNMRLFRWRSGNGALIEGPINDFTKHQIEKFSLGTLHPSTVAKMLVVDGFRLYKVRGHRQPKQSIIAPPTPATPIQMQKTKEYDVVIVESGIRISVGRKDGSVTIQVSR